MKMNAMEMFSVKAGKFSVNPHMQRTMAGLTEKGEPKWRDFWIELFRPITILAVTIGSLMLGPILGAIAKG